MLHGLVDIRVLGEILAEAAIFLAGGQSPEDQQPRHLSKVGIMLELFDRYAPVVEYAFLAVDESDGAIAATRVSITLIQGKQLGLERWQVRDINLPNL